MERTATIKLDIDGVMRDCVTPLLDIYNAEFGESVVYADIKDWDIGKFLKHNKKYGEYFAKHPVEIFENSPMYHENIPEVVKALQEKYIIHVTTNQFKGLEGHTINWLHNNNIPYDNISFARDKTIISGGMLIDDGLHNLEASVKNGETAICFDQPWNQEWKGHRIKRLDELLSDGIIHTTKYYDMNRNR